MAVRVQTYVKFPWDGGINTSVDAGALNDNDLVAAEDIVFNTSGVRAKREGYSYLDTTIAAPDFRTSSSFTKTLTWTTNYIQNNLTTADNLLVAGELITVTAPAAGDESSYAEENVTITSVAQIAEVTDIQCVADVSSSLNDTYFYLNGGPAQGEYYVWYNVGGAGSDPDIDGKTPIEVAISANDSANTVASATQTAIDAFSDFSASVSTDTVTVTNVKAGVNTDATDAGSTGFTITVTTQGGQSITYTATNSASQTISSAASITVARAYSILNIKDYWYFNNNEKNQTLVTVTDQGQFFEYNANGDRTEISKNGSVSITPTLLEAYSTVINNKLIISMDSVGNTPVKYDPANSSTIDPLGGSPPDFKISTEYLGRLWVNDKTDPDRLHYSATGDVESWNGSDDSGALDIAPGDGDNQGITGIVAFKDILFVAKANSLYRILGNAPENFKVELVSKGIGMTSHGGIATVDDNDVSFISRRGIHSIAATDQYGDTETAYISAKIQPTFNKFDKDLLHKMQSIYVPELNSVAYAISENTVSNDNLYFYHTLKKEWYKWPNVSCEALAQRLVNNQTKLLMGTSDGRVIQALNDAFTDFGTTGISYRVKTGRVYPGGNPVSMKRFHRVGLLYKPIGSTTFTLTVKVDNQSEQSFSFTQGTDGDLLGTDFILGTSVLGNDKAYAPFMTTVDGWGRGIQLTITQSGTDRQVEIYGFIIEFEDLATYPEVV